MTAWKPYPTDARVEYRERGEGSTEYRTAGRDGLAWVEEYDDGRSASVIVHTGENIAPLGVYLIDCAHARAVRWARRRASR